MKKFLAIIMAIAMIITIVPAVVIADDVTGSDVTGSDTIGSDPEIIATHYYGDVNFDDTLNTFDAAEILRMCADIIMPTNEHQELTYEGFMKIDANKDNALNTADAAFVLKVSADMKLPNEYYEYAAQPTTEPTSEPTSEPTTEPTGEPTAEPTAEPTPTPDQSDAYLIINCFDSFNEIQVAGTRMGVHNGTNVINAENIELPEEDCSYILENENFQVTVTVENGVATPASINVNVIPVLADDDGNIYKVIFNTTGFNKINKDLEGNYCLGADINCGGEMRQPFGWNWTDPTQEDQVFMGIFDGLGHYVLNFKMDYCNDYDGQNSDYNYYSNVGLFAMNAGTIRNMGVLGSVFGDVNVGVLVGINGGLIEECYCYGNVGSMDFIETSRGGAGGICGQNQGIISKSCFEGSVAGFYWIGGITGKNFGRITESYFAGDVNYGLDDQIVYDYAVRYIGGIAGGSTGEISDCYVYCAPYICGYMAVGGMVGWASGGSIKNVFVVNALEYADEYCDDAVGYYPDGQAPAHSGLAASDDENLPMPSGYSPDVWDMNGASHKTFPDLINNRRAEDGFYVD